jgi:hypothetical protein
MQAIEDQSVGSRAPEPLASFNMKLRSVFGPSILFPQHEIHLPE